MLLLLDCADAFALRYNSCGFYKYFTIDFFILARSTATHFVKSGLLFYACLMLMLATTFQ